MYTNQALNDPFLSVSEFAQQLRGALETSFSAQWIRGEISNLTYAPSGHVYFSLKDARAQLRCTLWRQKAQTLGWRLENGQQVEACVSASLYEPRGDLQLNVQLMRRAGLGQLYETFLKLKAKLEAEGLFATEHKRPLPRFPRTIGVVTSAQAAAWHDVQTALERRAPYASIRLAPTLVQGPAAVPGVVQALQSLSKTEVDLIILCRGGGSLEDLWAFNDEAIARAIRACPIPVITGIGHETDFTIADFAADLRAPTPTAAAELACPSRDSLLSQLAQLSQRLQRASEVRLYQHAQGLDQLAARLLHPRTRLQLLHTQLHGLAHRLELAGHRLVETRSQRLKQLAGSLQHLNPTAILSRGFSIVRHPAGHLVTAASQLQPLDTLHIQFAEGEVQATVCENKP